MCRGTPNHTNTHSHTSPHSDTYSYKGNVTFLSKGPLCPGKDTLPPPVYTPSSLPLRHKKGLRTDRSGVSR